AVNIVDYIDNDDYMTAMNWLAVNEQLGRNLAQPIPPSAVSGWVFGTERPRLVINETYTRFENDPTDTFPGNKAEKNFWMRTWVEMHNPVTPASPAEQFSGSEGYYQDPSQAAGWNPDDQLHGGYRTTVAENSGGTQSSVYRVLVTKIRQAVVANPDPMGMRDPNNVAGYPSTPLEPVVWFANVAGTQTVRHQQAAPLGQVVEPNVDLTGMGPPYGWTGANKNRSFFVVGPEADQTGWQPGMQGNTAAQIQNGGQQDQAELTSASLQWEIQRDPMMGDYTPPAMVGELGKVTWAPGFVLQRLACPAQPPGPTNPYVTIDYWDNDPVTVGNRLKYDMDGNGTGMEPPWEQTYAWGRRQPYDAVMMFQGQAPNGQQATALYRQQPNGVAQNPNHTFWQHNGQAQQRQQNDNWTNLGTTLEQPFRPLAHYDRVVINPTELFHVVAVRPHEFSQLFHGPPGAQPASDGLTTTAPSAGRLKFTADWLDHGVTNGPGGRLHRALGLVRTGTHIQGLGRGGRVPGKININTIFSQQVFDAVCDALLANTRTGPNRFNQDDVNAAWNALLASRHQTPGQFSVTDRPFVGNLTAIGDVGAAGNTVPYGRERTVSRPNMLWPENAAADGNAYENYVPGPAVPTGPRTLGQPHAGAIEKFDMLSKVYNQFTTRSNCFAVYTTIGYFEVRNPAPYNEQNRPILGKELGTDEGTVTRHKFFSIVDRTNMTFEPPTAPNLPVKQGQPPVYFSYEPDVQFSSAATGYQAVPDPVPPPGGGPIQVLVPSLGPQGTSVVGNYDGINWTITPGQSWVMLDTGDRQEGPLPVMAVSANPGTRTAALIIGQPAGPGALTVTKQHFRGSIIRLINPDPTQPGFVMQNPGGGAPPVPVAASIPGNPGPQPGFNYKSPRYSSVVKYVEQLR
ncbi:MAG TPA: hypothetical protein VKD90_14520, partial [Gemmataceae bacterium]|nr:hypothetical protein [Gemmataceae bacterium]